MAAQVTHAAGESSPGNLPPGTYAIVLTCEDLTELSQHLSKQGVEHKTIVENSGPYSGQATAIGVAPKPRSELRRHFSSFPLLK